MFNEDLFKLDTSVVPAAIRYDHVNPKEDNMRYNMFFLCKHCKLKVNNTPQHNDNVVRCCVVLCCVVVLFCFVLCCVVLCCVVLCCVAGSLTSSVGFAGMLITVPMLFKCFNITGRMKT